MKINHEKTKNKIIETLGILREHASYTKSFKEKLVSIEMDEVYSSEYKKSKIQELKNDYYNKHSEVKEVLTEKINSILEMETENEKVLEFDIPEFNNTLSVIHTLKGNLPHDVINSIKYNFAGNYQVLLTLENAMKGYEINTQNAGYDKYTQTAAEALEDIFLKVENLEYSEDTKVIDLKRIFESLVSFGEVRGIAFSENEKDLGMALEDAQEMIARKAMGLA